MSARTPSIEAYGDFALYLHYPGGGYDAQISAHVLALAARLRASGIWRDVIAGYDSLLASFDPAGLSSSAAVEQLHAALKSENEAFAARAKGAAEKQAAPDQGLQWRVWVRGSAQSAAPSAPSQAAIARAGGFCRDWRLADGNL
jgi:hypothetical protein